MSEELEAQDNYIIGRDYTAGHRQPFSLRDKWNLLGAVDAACYVAAAPWAILSLVLVWLFYADVAALTNPDLAAVLATAFVAGPAMRIGYKVHKAELQIRDWPRITGTLAGILHARITGGESASGVIKAEPKLRIHRFVHLRSEHEQKKR